MPVNSINSNNYAAYDNYNTNNNNQSQKTASNNNEATNNSTADNNTDNSSLIGGSTRSADKLVSDSQRAHSQRNGEQYREEPVKRSINPGEKYNHQTTPKHYETPNRSL